MPLCGEVVGERGMGGGAEGGESGNAVQCKAMSLGYYCTIRVFIDMGECVCSYSRPQWRILEGEGRWLCRRAPWKKHCRKGYWCHL